MEQAIPYKGNDPYIFISYAHRDSESVLPIIRTMQSAGFRVWFDEGIDPGTEWDNVIAAQIENCGYFLALVSGNYLASENCKDELNFARDLGKQRLLVYLEDVTLPSGMAMRMNRIQSVFKYKYADENRFYDVLYSAEGIRSMCDGEVPLDEHVSHGKGPASEQPSGNSFGYHREFDQERPSSFRKQKKIKKDITLSALTKNTLQNAKYAFCTADRVLARLFALCVYALCFALGIGYATLAISLLLPILVFGIGSRIALKAGEAKKPELYYELELRKELRGEVARNLARIFFAFTLMLMRNPGAPQNIFLFLSLYCYVVSLFPNNCGALRIGSVRIPRALARTVILALAIILFAAST